MHLNPITLPLIWGCRHARGTALASPFLTSLLCLYFRPPLRLQLQSASCSMAPSRRRRRRCRMARALCLAPQTNNLPGSLAWPSYVVSTQMGLLQKKVKKLSWHLLSGKCPAICSVASASWSTAWWCAPFKCLVVYPSPLWPRDVPQSSMAWWCAAVLYAPPCFSPPRPTCLTSISSLTLLSHTAS